VLLVQAAFGNALAADSIQERLQESKRSVETLLAIGERSFVCADIAYLQRPLADGLTYYYRAGTKEVISVCGGACWRPNEEQATMCSNLCPPPQWRDNGCDAKHHLHRLLSA
jgi:hypothetical protein